MLWFEFCYYYWRRRGDWRLIFQKSRVLSRYEDLVNGWRFGIQVSERCLMMVCRGKDGGEKRMTSSGHHLAASFLVDI